MVFFVLSSIILCEGATKVTFHAFGSVCIVLAKHVGNDVSGSVLRNIVEFGGARHYVFMYRV